MISPHAPAYHSALWLFHVLFFYYPLKSVNDVLSRATRPFGGRHSFTHATTQRHALGQNVESNTAAVATLLAEIALSAWLPASARIALAACPKDIFSSIHDVV